MSKKYFIVFVVMLATIVVAVKTFFVVNPPSPRSKSVEVADPYAYINAALPTEANAEIVKRSLDIQNLARSLDRDQAIKKLEDLEKEQKNAFLADRLRRAVLALRFNQPLDNHTEAELMKLLLESKRSM